MKELGGMTVACFLTGQPGPVSNRELIYWQAYCRIENEQFEQRALASQAKANLPHYQRKA